MKSEVDQKKGAKLDAISQVVTEINAKISEVKNTLGPKVKNLRQARTALEELQSKHSEARATYIRVQDAQQSKFGSLDERVAALQAATAEVQATLVYKRSMNYMSGMAIWKCIGDLFPNADPSPSCLFLTS
jgi:chromosome segregation ATPase